MTPYITGCKAIIDPLTKTQTKDLLFGSVDKKYYNMIGTIVDQKYLTPKLTQVYEILFPDHVKLWFAEKELVAFTR